MALEKGLLVERLQPLDRENQLLHRLGALVLGQKLCDLRVVRPVDPDRRGVLAERRQQAVADVVGAGERASAADRPVERRGVERERLFDLVQQVERVARLAVHLVDESDDRNIA